MPQKKKLQVFISSTYNDLIDERQAAVEAVLTAGHIPAGMELFAAGDQSQMNVIKRWIDESDVYLLILGGRYGSIERTSGKSYVQLEYEYALGIGKPLFAIVIEDNHLEEKIKKYGSAVFEKHNPQLLKEFKELVLSKVVRFWTDLKDIKLAIFEKLSQLSIREDLIGWVQGNQVVNTAMVAEEIARLAKENEVLRQKISELESSSEKFNGLTFQELYDMLNQEDVTPHLNQFTKSHVINPTFDILKEISSSFKDPFPSLLHFLWHIQNLRSTERVGKAGQFLTQRLEFYGLIRRFADKSFQWTPEGKTFVLQLVKEKGNDETKNLVLK